MKIAFLIPKLKGGGAERVISNLSLNLPKEIEQHIIVFERNAVEYSHCAKIIETNLSSRKSIFRKGINIILRIIKIREIKNNEKYDVVISFLEGANIVNIFSRRKEKVIVALHNYLKENEDKLIGKLMSFIIKHSFNKADLIIAVSRQLEKRLIDEFGIKENKIKVVYNPIDHKQIELLKYEDIPPEEKAIFNARVIINVGRIDTIKGQWHLIKAFSIIRKQLENIHLVFLGEGNIESELKDLCTYFGIEKDVYFLGYKENPYKYLYNSEIFALSSLSEGFPNVVLEAMACSLPIVSVDCKSGPREILEPSLDISETILDTRKSEYGILTPQFDSKVDVNNRKIISEEYELANALIDLLNDTPELKKYRRKSEERAHDFYVESILEKWLEILG